MAVAVAYPMSALGKRTRDQNESKGEDDFAALVAFIKANWATLSLSQKKLLRVQHNVRVEKQPDQQLKVVRVNNDKRQKSVTQEEELQRWISDATETPYEPETNKLRLLLYSLAIKHLDYDISDIDMSLGGSNHDGNMVEISPLSADTIIFIAHAEADEIVNGKFIKSTFHVQFLSKFLKAHGFESVWVKAVRLYMDADCRYGVLQPIPHMRYKVSTPDVDLRQLLKILRDPGEMEVLLKHGIRYRAIDIKLDVACTVTPIIQARIVPLLNAEFGTEFTLEPQVTKGMVVACDVGGLYRAKFYNKFQETVVSPGVQVKCGDQTSKWVMPSSDVMRKAIRNPATQARGYSRVEITWRSSRPPSDEETENIVRRFANRFFTHANYTPISVQWTHLKPKNTVCVMDMVSGNFVFGRFRERNRRLNGICGRARTTVQLIHRLKLCSFPKGGIKMICIDSRVSDKKGVVLHDAAFTLPNEFQPFRSDCVQQDFKLRAFDLVRLGPYDKTHYFKNNSMYSSAKSDIQLAGLGLTDTDSIKPAVFTERVAPGAKLLEVKLALAPTAPVGCTPAIVSITILAGVPPNGTYLFTKFFSSRQKFGESVASVECVELSNGETYLFDGPWCKWKSLFVLNEGFPFHVVNGELQLNETDSPPKQKPLNMMMLPTDKAFVVARVFDTTHYKKTKTAVVLMGYPDVSFFATPQLVALLDAGSLKFRTCGEGYDEARHKMRLVEVYVNNAI